MIDLSLKGKHNKNQESKHNNIGDFENSVTVVRNLILNGNHNIIIAALLTAFVVRNLILNGNHNASRKEVVEDLSLKRQSQSAHSLRIGVSD